MSRTTSPYVVALLVVALGLCVVYMTTQISVPAAYAKVGPTVFPYSIGVALLVLGGLLLIDAWRQRWDCEATDPASHKPDIVSMSWVLAGMALNLALIGFVGFILSSTVMFVFIAKGFSARRLWLAAAVGFILALIAYYGFAQVLGLRMGSGLIEDLL
ncbi:tripartite tricarboxylate transporter TctB family protein [Aliihoeflea aestuarii]|uniref:tripartite tricarboxylate transporter TctB family protein n=1 Tax=Aliihoeflea aestuarii TaxID=453840 RepID=UPI0020937C44|nr:tripartite tricarboxylate transporter TctB family protein [Aliihoeflea aestuarii]